MPNTLPAESARNVARCVPAPPRFAVDCQYRRFHAGRVVARCRSRQAASSRSACGRNRGRRTRCDDRSHERTGKPNIEHAPSASPRSDHGALRHRRRSRARAPTRGLGAEDSGPFLLASRIVARSPRAGQLRPGGARCHDRGAPVDMIFDEVHQVSPSLSGRARPRTSCASF